MFHETDADNTHHFAIKISVERPEIDCAFMRCDQFLVERKTSVLFDNDDTLHKQSPCFICLSSVKIIYGKISNVKEQSNFKMES